MVPALTLCECVFLFACLYTDLAQCHPLIYLCLASHVPAPVGKSTESLDFALSESDATM